MRKGLALRYRRQSRTMKNKIIRTLLILCIGIAMVRCNKDNMEPLNSSITNPLYTGVFTDLSTEVITRNYEDLNNNAITLKAAADAMTVGDEAQLTVLKDSWRTARASWELSQAISYGPIESGALSIPIDKSPVVISEINTLLAGSAPIVIDSVQAKPNVRGFHLIEYLAWGTSGNKPASDLTDREIDLIQVAAQDIQNNTQLLYNGWKADGDNFSSSLVNAGQSGSIYTNQEDALVAISNGLVLLADDVSGVKIGIPYDAQVATGNGVNFEESRYSGNSLADFRNNLLSIQNIYLGKYGTADESGLTDIVESKDAALDAELKTAITDAIASVDAIPVSFSDALANNLPVVENAKIKIAELKSKLETKLLPLFAAN